MEIYERVQYLRKKVLKMTQDNFGNALGVSRDTIANIEQNRLARPEQKEPLIKLICKTFNVSYEWLTTGEGDMYVQTKKSFIEKLSAEYGLSFTAQKIVECYLSLDDGQRDTVDYFITYIAESIIKAPAKIVDAPQFTVIDESIGRVDA